MNGPNFRSETQNHVLHIGARATLTRAIKMDGTFAPAYSYRGFAWYREGQTAKDAVMRLVRASSASMPTPLGCRPQWSIGPPLLTPYSSPYQRGFNASLLGRVQAVKLIKHNVLP